jgi:hypothetical protein
MFNYNIFLIFISKNINGNKLFATVKSFKFDPGGRKICSKPEIKKYKIIIPHSLLHEELALEVV